MKTEAQIQLFHSVFNDELEKAKKYSVDEIQTRLNHLLNHDKIKLDASIRAFRIARQAKKG